MNTWQPTDPEPGRKMNKQADPARKRAYRIIIEEGNIVPSYRAFLTTAAMFNRCAKRAKREGLTTTHTHLAVLSTIALLHYARGHKRPFSFKLLMRNYGTAFQQMSALFAVVRHLALNGMIVLVDKNTLKGTTIKLTHIGEARVQLMYEELKRITAFYPENN